MLLIFRNAGKNHSVWLSQSTIKNRKRQVKGNIAYILALERARQNGRLFLSRHHVAKKKSVAHCLR